MIKKSYALFAACMSIPVIAVAPNMSYAEENDAFYTLNPLENDAWKNVSDQQIYDWLYENGITNTKELNSSVQFWFTFSSLADYLSKTGILDIPEDTYYFTDELGFYSAYCWEIRKIFDKYNYPLPNGWLNYQDLALLLPEIFPQYKGLTEAEALREAGVLRSNVYDPNQTLYQYEAGRAIYYGLHTLNLNSIPTKSKYLSTFSYNPIKQPSTNIETPINNSNDTVYFSDVSKKSAYFAIIQDMRNRNIINGFDDGSFRPTANISRQHASAMILRYSDLLAPYKTTSADLNDIKESSEYYRALIEMQRRNIFVADSNNKIYPSKEITRAEVAAALVNLLDLTPITINTKVNNYSFSDIKGNAFKKEIEAALKAGILTGYSDGTFKPNTSISRQHFAVMMSRAISFKEQKMLTLDKNTKLSNYSTTDIPNIDVNLDYGMTRTEYIENLKADFEIAKHQIIATSVSSGTISYDPKTSLKENILRVFKPSKLSDEQAIQAFNYIFYTGKTLIINNDAYQYRHPDKSIHKSNGFESND